jgi:glycosyltransferase involved in cell wall biosynthesis
MRILLDLQGAQGENSGRGIGKYTISLAESIVLNSGCHDVSVLLNGSLSNTYNELRERFLGILPAENIYTWYMPESVPGDVKNTTWYRGCCELIREAVIARINPDVVHLSSLFEGAVSDAVTSVGEFCNNVPTIVTLYDLIPLIHKHVYLQNPEMDLWYQRKLNYLLRADHLLSISESSKKEGCENLGIPEHLITNISSAIDERYYSDKPTAEMVNNAKCKYGISHQYLMYTGGYDHRKNIEGLIKAYAALGSTVREGRQLVIVCGMQDADKTRLTNIGKANGLRANELVLTGYVPDNELHALYYGTELFVFPSLHEGFGLPVLEAMACGAAVIGSNASSIPEVLNNDDALFDPRDIPSISKKMSEVLSTPSILESLRAHSKLQCKKFSWDECAKKALAAFEFVHEHSTISTDCVQRSNSRKKLAYVSPLPPMNSGIADYSAELLPELSRYYDIDVVVSQDVVADSWVRANHVIISTEQLKANSSHYHRVIYHFGNSEFHTDMFNLQKAVPGIVVLHDFFLSGVIAHTDLTKQNPGWWARELYYSHGYYAVAERFSSNDVADIIWKFPASYSVIRDSIGVLVHSPFSCDLAEEWYPMHSTANWCHVPLLRKKRKYNEGGEWRQRLGLNAQDFVVCSFGQLGITKLNDKIIDAWIDGGFSRDSGCKMVFVGKDPSGHYQKRLEQLEKSTDVPLNIQITGYVDADVYKSYLHASDVAIQLRTKTRGETSAAVLDCLSYGIPTIVNANGSMAYLPDSCVVKIDDEFEPSELTNALRELCQNMEKRELLSLESRQFVAKEHSPRLVGDMYFKAIEKAYDVHSVGRDALIEKTFQLTNQDEELSSVVLVDMAKAIAKNIPAPVAHKQLFVDVSELVVHDAQSGIQRVVRAILNELLTAHPQGFRVEPVYASLEHGYRYAREFSLKFLSCPPCDLADEAIEMHPGDVFLGLDLQPHVVPCHSRIFKDMREYGVKTYFVVYDLLPSLHPEWFVDGAKNIFDTWLKEVTRADGLLCISKATAKDLSDWIAVHTGSVSSKDIVKSFNLGADIVSSMPSEGYPDDFHHHLHKIKSKQSVLMVGTIEPRKGYQYALAAFERIWESDLDVNLVIVGKEGWLVTDLVQKIYAHKELGKRLFWFEGISDMALLELYEAATGLLVTSEGEGYGLPIIEAANHSLPVLTRDIPVFREIAGDNVEYFSDDCPFELSGSLLRWLDSVANESARNVMDVNVVSWADSARQLIDFVVEAN